MYSSNIFKKTESKKKLKNKKGGRNFLSMAIILFISFSLLNVFLIFNFMSILNKTVII